MFEQILPDALVQAGGWAILHSLWQGALITLLLAFVLGRTRQHPPALRYQLSAGALLLLLGAVAFTFFYYYEPASGASAFYRETGESLGTYPLTESTAAISAGKNSLSQYFPFLLQVWLVGVVLMGIRMLGELAYLHRLRSTKVQAVSDHWMETLNTLRWKMGILQPVLLKESPRVSGPMLIGWVKPVILLPIGILSGLSPQQVACVLAHELAHVRRMDYLLNLLQSAVEVFLFFNPAVWWISAQIREEREHCCDELAVAVTGDRLTLVKTLAQLEERRLQTDHLSLAFNGRPQGMLGRVQRLLGGESSVRIIGKGLWSLLFFCLATGLLAFRDQAVNIIPETEIGKTVLQTEIIDGRTAIRTSPASSPKILSLDRDLTEEESAQAAEQSTTEAVETVPLLTRQIEKLVLSGLSPLKSLRDTVPDEKLEKEMRALQKEMEQLQQKMMESPEMEQIRGLTKKYEQEMRAMQEKMMKEQGGYENMMEEQRKVMEQVEGRHRELMESEAFKAIQEEMEVLSQEMSRRAEEMRQRFQNDPDLLEQKLDSISQIFEEKHEKFERQHEKVFESFEKEMKALENSPEMKELELKMEAMEEEMEQLMEGQMEPLEEQMEQLQEAMEEKFEKQMELLQEKMEKLEQQRWNKNNKREE